MKGNERSLLSTALSNEKTQNNRNQSNNYRHNKTITSFEDCFRKFDDFREKA